MRIQKFDFIDIASTTININFILIEIVNNNCLNGDILNLDILFFVSMIKCWLNFSNFFFEFLT